MLSFWGTLLLIMGAYAVFHITIIQGTKYVLNRLLPKDDPMTDTDQQIRDLIEMVDMQQSDRRNRGEYTHHQSDKTLITKQTQSLHFCKTLTRSI